MSLWQNNGKFFKGAKPVFDKLRSRLVQAGPSLLRVPVRLTPFAVKRQVLEQVLGWQFRQALQDGELDFLAGRWLSIEVRDLGLKWFTSVEDNKLLVCDDAPADVSFSAEANDLLLIAARKQDPDTLFFQRRLVIEGDTELGLYVKNLMDAIELDAMPKPLRILLLQLADFVEAGLRHNPASEGNSIGEPC
nr:SCP2 domain-containing protein [Cedecea sp. P7760]